MEKSNPKLLICTFWILIIFALYSTLAILKNNAYKINVKGLNGPLKPVSINFELEEKYHPNKLLVCFNDYCKAPESDYFRNVYSYKFDKEQEGFFETKVKNVYLAYPVEIKDFKKNIKNIDLNVGMKNYYYSNEDIASFDEKKFSVEFKKGDFGHYGVVVLPEINNYKGLMKHFLILFMALFYNWSLFIVPYFWLFVAVLIYIFNKDKFNIKFNKKIILPAVILLISFVVLISLIAYLKKDNGYNNFINFVKKDSARYKDDYKVHIITSKTCEIEGVLCHKAENLFEIVKKDNYAINDKKAVIYFNSNETDVYKTSVFNPKAYVYTTNSSTNAKLIYE